MKFKNTILLASLVIVGLFGLSQATLADNSVLSVLPASLNSTVGTTFNASVQLNPTNNKVCVIKGTLSLTNLACQNITVASGLYSAIAPTCANPTFLIGIPKCTTSAQNILSVSVKGFQLGQANLSVTGIKVIGTGTNIAFVSQSGAYSISAVQTNTPTTTPTVTQPTTTPTQEITQPTEEITQQPATPTDNTPADAGAAGLTSNVAAAGLLSSIGSNWLVLLLIVLVIIVAYGIYYFVVKKKK